MEQEFPRTDTPVQQDAEVEERAKQETQLETQHASGANWFYWIAGLSVINSVIILAGGGWGFVVGLGITQFIDAIATVVVAETGASGGPQSSTHLAEPRKFAVNQ